MNNDYVNSATVNQSSSKLLLNCSDGVLRLYQFDVETRLLVLVQQFEDAITKQRWFSSSFITLPPMTKIVDESVVREYNSDIQLTTETLSTATKFVNKESQEIFVASLGTQNASSLIFYNADGNLKEIKRVNLQ